MTPCELVALIERHGPRWRGLPGVRGVGGRQWGDDVWIVVYADQPVVGVPAEVEGICVEIVTGAEAPGAPADD